MLCLRPPNFGLFASKIKRQGRPRPKWLKWRVKGFFGNLKENRLYLRVSLRALQLPLTLPGIGFPPMVTGTWLGAASGLYQKITGLPSERSEAGR